MTAFEDFLQLELPRRSALLTLGITGYDGDPNDGGAPSIIQNAPFGTWFREETLARWWRKTETVWEQQNVGGGPTGPQTIPEVGIATQEDMTWTVDYATGTSPPDGTVVTTQAEFTALGAPLKYVQDVARIRPMYIDHVVDVQILAGDQYARPGTLSPLGAILYDYAPLFVSHVSPGFKIGAPFPYSFPGIYFTGATTDLDASVAGTLIVGDGESTFQRSAGSWTLGALAGKRIEVLSGVGAGTKALIIDNTLDTLTLQTEASGSSGAATIRTYEHATTLIPRQDSGGPIALHSMLVGNLVSNPSWVPYNFVDLQITRPTDFSFIGVSNHQTGYYYCDVHSVSIDFTGICRTTFNGCLVNLITFGTGAITMASTTSEYTIANTLITGGNALGNLLKIQDKPIVNMQNSRITPAGTFTGFAAQLLNGAVVDCEVGATRIEGNGSCSGASLADTGGTNILDDSGFFIIDNCAVALQVDKGVLKIEGFRGSGNTTVFKIQNGADVAFLRSGHTCTGTNFADIDGTLYAETNWTTAGDEVVGTAGARLLAF